MGVLSPRLSLPALGLDAILVYVWSSTRSTARHDDAPVGMISRAEPCGSHAIDKVAGAYDWLLAPVGTRLHGRAT